MIKLSPKSAKAKFVLHQKGLEQNWSKLSLVKKNKHQQYKFSILFHFNFVKLTLHLFWEKHTFSYHIYISDTSSLYNKCTLVGSLKVGLNKIVTNTDELDMDSCTKISFLNKIDFFVLFTSVKLYLYHQTEPQHCFNLYVFLLLSLWLL